MAAKLKLTDLYWLAGLLEGEGCFSIGKRKVKNKEYKRIIIQVIMTYKESIEKVAKILGENFTECRNKTKGNKNIYRTAVNGSNKAIQWMMTLYPLMSPRRQNKIKECIDVWKNMPGRCLPPEFKANIGKISNIKYTQKAGVLSQTM